MTSWVIVNKKTDKAIFETFNKMTADKFELLKGYTVVPILIYLVSLNKKRSED